MAEDDDKTEQPTAKKLKDARKEGQVARSRELNTMLSLFVGSLAFTLLGQFMLKDIIRMFEGGFRLSPDSAKDPALALLAVGNAATDALWLLAPFLLVMFLSVFIGPLLLGGWNFSTKSLAPKFSKLNPLSGLKRMFGPNGLVELFKALAKFLLLGSIAWLIFSWKKHEIVALGVQPINIGMMHGAELLFMLFFALTGVLILIAAFDVPYQLWQHTKKLKMSRQEIKDEHKQTEGSPEVKGRIRMLQRQLAQRRMLEAVPEVDVIVVNPTHFSVALKYDEDGGGAPKLVAKGVDELALKIREIGKAHDVPIFSAPPLARALYYSTEVDQYIPEGLYVAVAKVLAYIFQLRQPGLYPQRPTNFDIPAEFLELERKNNRFNR